MTTNIGAALRYFGAQKRTSFDSVAQAVRRFAAPDAAWRLFHPINELRGSEAFLERYWKGLLRAIPDLERRDDILLSGEFAGKFWIAASGYLLGTFEEDWLGIKAHKGAVAMRYGEFLALRDGQIIQGNLLLDVVALARQTGRDLVPAGLALEGYAPPPASFDGLRRQRALAEDTQKSLQLVEKLIDVLNCYDGRSLASTKAEDFWHPDMMWYGPTGIGTTRGIQGFQRYHQEPFLAFLPNRKGGFHYARIADGPYIASGGWPSVRALTSSAGWISTDLPAGVPVGLRVMDFWRREDDLFKENWVFIDIPDLFRQCGKDPFAT